MKGAMKYHLSRTQQHTFIKPMEIPNQKRPFSNDTAPWPEEKIPVPQGRFPFLQELRDFKIPVIGFL
jgi:hypothetical protein